MREMKNSGIEWIGEIPKDWEVHPVYVYFEEGKTKNYRMQEQNLLSLSYGRIIRKDINTNGGLLPASFNTYNVVEAGDIIIRPTDLQNDKRSLRTGLVKEQGIITSAYIDLRPKDNVNSKYYHYLLHSYDIIKVFYNMGNGVRQGLNFSEFAKLLLLEPTTVEQQQIADYLDTQCSEIDATAEDIQKEITLLEEYKKSVITEAVTKGLNPDAEMKDSGIEGIKEIPVISKVVRLKYLVDKKITDGTHKTPEYATVDDGSPFLSSKDVRNGYIDWSNVKYITKTLHNILHKEVCCKRGDILLAKNGTTGVAALVDTDDVFDIYVTLAVIRSDKKKVLPEYLLYSINSNVTKEQFSERLVGIGVPNLHLNVIENTNIIVYEISEQQKIVKYLNEKCSCIDDAILIKKKQLEMLADYKKSLIYEYVTGKKEVPHE